MGCRRHIVCARHFEDSRTWWLLRAKRAARCPARRVVVVLEDSTDEQAPSSLAQILRNARGSLGRGNREAVLAELARSRQDWER